MEKRCEWCGNDPLYVAYHDQEWGTPIHDDRKLFEFLVLESAQAGLSWITVLRKRENYREAFDGFDPEKIALYDENKIEELMKNSGIIRNRRKIESTINNAQKFLEIQEEFGSFNSYVWSYVGGLPIKNSWRNIREVPATSLVSDTLSKDLKRRGFKFFGSTICYAYMQAVGMVNDHILDCYRYDGVISPVHIPDYL